MKIADRVISDQHAPFIIAELSGNHGQCLKTAEKMIIAAAKSGVDAIKLQTYTADTITLNSDLKEFQIREDSSLWQGQNLYSLYQKAHTPWEWQHNLFLLAREHGLIAFSSPFDETSVDFLEGLNVPCYKIASFELNHFPLLRKVAQTGKPVIMSTGMATETEISEAVAYLKKYGCSQLALLKCTSCYPASVSDANLATIEDMKKRFNVPVGLSDHSKGIGVSIVAAALGANIIERHFVLDDNSGAVDAAFSSTPAEFSCLVRETKDLEKAIGQVHYGPTDAEQDSVKYRRSIYISDALNAGDVITASHIKVIRPGYGLAPKYWDDVIGRVMLVGKGKNTPLLESDFR